MRTSTIWYLTLTAATVTAATITESGYILVCDDDEPTPAINSSAGSSWASSTITALPGQISSLSTSQPGVETAELVSSTLSDLVISAESQYPSVIIETITTTALDYTSTYVVTITSCSGGPCTR